LQEAGREQETDNRQEEKLGGEQAGALAIELVNASLSPEGSSFPRLPGI
jgi:hypothetical protein